jgi:hypothetical protein
MLRIVDSSVQFEELMKKKRSSEGRSEDLTMSSVIWIFHVGIDPTIVAYCDLVKSSKSNSNRMARRN